MKVINFMVSCDFVFKYWAWLRNFLFDVLLKFIVMIVKRNFLKIPVVLNFWKMNSNLRCWLSVRILFLTQGQIRKVINQTFTLFLLLWHQSFCIKHFDLSQIWSKFIFMVILLLFKSIKLFRIRIANRTKLLLFHKLGFWSL